MIARAAENSEFALVSGEFVKIYLRALNERPYIPTGRVWEKWKRVCFATHPFLNQPKKVAVSICW